MPSSESIPPLGDDEILYRRIQEVHGKTSPLNKNAYRPVERDADGISFTRALYNSPEEAARGRGEKKYYIARLRVNDIKKLELSVVPSPTADDLGHVHIPELNYADRKSDVSETAQHGLAKLSDGNLSGPY